MMVRQTIASPGTMVCGQNGCAQGRERNPMTPPANSSIPAQLQPAFDAIVRLTDFFCQAHLTHEYQMLCREMAGVLARKRPSPLLRGKPEIWACGIVRVVGWVNFLDGGRHKPSMKLTTIDKRFGVPSATGQSKSKAIRDLLDIHQFSEEWTLPSQRECLPPRSVAFQFPSGLMTIHWG
jgi:Domain of unknown function (DUF6398)